MLHSDSRQKNANSLPYCICVLEARATPYSLVWMLRIPHLPADLAGGDTHIHVRLVVGLTGRTHGVARGLEGCGLYRPHYIPFSLSW